MKIMYMYILQYKESCISNEAWLQSFLMYSVKFFWHKTNMYTVLFTVK